LIHIGLISFQRHHAELAEQLGESLLTDVAAYPGLDTLIRVTLGRVASEEVLGAADSDHRRCQLHLAAGSGRLSRWDVEGARAELDACVATAAECIEHALAEAERKLLVQLASAGGGEGTAGPAVLAL